MTISLLSNLFNRTSITNNYFMGDMSIEDKIRFVKETNYEQVLIKYPKEAKTTEPPKAIEPQEVAEPCP